MHNISKLFFSHYIKLKMNQDNDIKNAKPAIKTLKQYMNQFSDEDLKNIVIRVKIQPLKRVAAGKAVQEEQIYDISGTNTEKVAKGLLSQLLKNIHHEGVVFVFYDRDHFICNHEWKDKAQKAVESGVTLLQDMATDMYINNDLLPSLLPQLKVSYKYKVTDEFYKEIKQIKYPAINDAESKRKGFEEHYEIFVRCFKAIEDLTEPKYQYSANSIQMKQIIIPIKN